MPNNFIDPYFSVVIKSKIFNTYCCLTTTKIINEDVPKIDDYYPIASSLELNVGLSFINEFEISLSPDIKSWFELLETDYFNIGNEVYLEYGYNKPKSVRYIIGQILTLPSVSFGDSPSFKISAKGVGFKGLLSRLDSSVVSDYNGKTFDEIINLFAKSIGATNVKKEYSDELGKTKVMNYPVEGSNWLRFQKFLIEHNCSAYFFGESLVVYSLDIVYTKSPEYVFVWGGNVDIGNNVYPIYNFEVNPEGIFLPQDIYLAQSFVSDINGEIIKRDSMFIKNLTLTGMPTSLDVKNIFNTKYVEENFDVNNELSLFLPEFLDDDIKQRVVSRLLLERANRVFSGSVSTIGNTDLLPGILVNIKGFGRIFDGKYMVFSTTHTIDSKGYIVSMDIKKNAFSELHDAIRNLKINDSYVESKESDIINKEEINR